MDYIEEYYKRYCVHCHGKGFNCVKHTFRYYDGTLIKYYEKEKCKYCKGTGKRCV